MGLEQRFTPNFKPDDETGSGLNEGLPSVETALTMPPLEFFSKDRLVRLGVPKSSAIRIERVIRQIIAEEAAQTNPLTNNETMQEFLHVRGEGSFIKNNFGERSLAWIRKILDDHGLPPLRKRT